MLDLYFALTQMYSVILLYLVFYVGLNQRLHLYFYAFVFLDLPDVIFERHALVCELAELPHALLLCFINYILFFLLFGLAVLKRVIFIGPFH